MARHVERIASRMKFLVSHVIQTELSDPRIGFMTVLAVEPTIDLREAKVKVSVLGSEGDRSKAEHALEQGRTFIQKRVGKNLALKNIPILRFEIVEPEDDAARRVEELLQKTAEEAAIDSDPDESSAS